MPGIFTDHYEYPKITPLKWYEKLILPFVYTRCVLDIQANETTLIYYKIFRNRVYVVKIVDIK